MLPAVDMTPMHLSTPCASSVTNPIAPLWIDEASH